MRIPRLQLRWEKAPGPQRGYYFCHYELVLPLDKDDIRGKLYDKNDKVKKERLTEFVVPMKPPQTRETSSTTGPCTYLEGGKLVYFYDTPYRDGAHAHWDAKLLGNLPIYVIAEDGTAIEEPEGSYEQ